MDFRDTEDSSACEKASAAPQKERCLGTLVARAGSMMVRSGKKDSWLTALLLPSGKMRDAPADISAPVPLRVGMSTSAQVRRGHSLILLRRWVGVVHG